jgi:hypothetical protein
MLHVPNLGHRFAANSQQPSRKLVGVNPSPSPSAQTSNRPSQILLLAAGLYLLINLFASPITPFLLGGDQTFFWLGGQRMSYGERVYLDFLRFTPPGTDLAYCTLFKLFGPRVWVTNFVVLAAGLAFTWQCFSIAAKIMPRRAATLATALFLVVIYGKPLNMTNHWFSALAIVFALNIASSQITPATLAVSAALLGLASFFNQAHGAAALLAFALFLLLRHPRTQDPPITLARNLAILLAAFTLTLALLSAPFIAQVGLHKLWYFQVTYVMRYAARITQGETLGLPGTLTLHTLPKLSQYIAVYLALPMAYLVSLWRCWRERNNPAFPWDRIALLALTGTLLFIEVAVNINWLRLYAIALPGIVLLIWTLKQSPRCPRPTFAILWLAILLLGAHQTYANRHTRPIRATFPGGRLATNPQLFDKLTFIAQRTRPGDNFFQAGWPGLYLPLQLRDPLYLSSVAYLEAARPQDIADTVRQLQSIPVPYILWTVTLDLHCPPGNLCSDYLTPLRTYLRTSYTPIQSFPDGDTLWQRKK